MNNWPPWRSRSSSPPPQPAQEAKGNRKARRKEKAKAHAAAKAAESAPSTPAAEPSATAQAVNKLLEGGAGGVLSATRWSRAYQTWSGGGATAAPVPVRVRTQWRGHERVLDAPTPATKPPPMPLHDEAGLSQAPSTSQTAGASKPPPVPASDAVDLGQGAHTSQPAPAKPSLGSVRVRSASEHSESADGSRSSGFAPSPSTGLTSQRLTSDSATPSSSRAFDTSGSFRSSRSERSGSIARSSDQRAATRSRPAGAWPPDYVGEAMTATKSDAFSVLKKGAVKDSSGAIPASEFARVSAYAMRSMTDIKHALSQQAKALGAPLRDTGFPFADTSFSVWSAHDKRVREFHFEYHRHTLLQTLENNLASLVGAMESHLQSDVTQAWVGQGGPQKLRQLHADIGAMRERVSGSLQILEKKLRNRLTAAYASGDAEACRVPPVETAVVQYVGQALTRHFNRSSPEAQEALTLNPAWRQLAAQVTRPALGYTYNVTGGPSTPEIISLLLNGTPEERSMKVGNATWVVDYFKRGGEERAFVARHVESGRAALLFHETKHVKEVNGSWSAAYDQELRKAGERLEKALAT